MPKSRAGSVVNKLEWVEARVGNYEQMKKFYKKTIGLPLNFEEERKDFIQYKAGTTKTRGFVPTFEVSNLDRFIKRMKQNKVRVGKRIVVGDHVRLVDFYDPNRNLLQAFEWK